MDLLHCENMKRQRRQLRNLQQSNDLQPSIFLWLPGTYFGVFDIRMEVFVRKK